jgi:hypothetical protein
VDVEDGHISLLSNRVENNEFKKEKNLEEFIVNNIHSFTKEILGDVLVSFEVDCAIEPQLRLPPVSRRRVDLIIRGQEKIYLIELKNPTCKGENRYAIGQILDYGREFLDPKKELIIMTTKFDINTAKTIKHYGLPIRYMYIDKKRIMEYIRDDGKSNIKG